MEHVRPEGCNMNISKSVLLRCSQGNRESNNNIGEGNLQTAKYCKKVNFYCSHYNTFHMYIYHGHSNKIFWGSLDFLCPIVK